MQSSSLTLRQSIGAFELPLTPEISHCQELLITLTLKGKRIVLQCVPGHCGNEQADLVAKKVANLLYLLKLFLKNLCRSNSLRDLQTRTALKSWRRVSPSSIPDKPRRDAVAAFRLTAGHDCLAAHLHHLGISSEPFCPLCDSGEVMERDHLLRCGALQGLTEVSRYWEAGAVLGNELWSSVFVTHSLLWGVHPDILPLDSPLVQSNCQPRSDPKPGDPNILHQPLVDRKNIIFPPLHIKLGLMKQFVKALSIEGDCFKYLISGFPSLSFGKRKAGVFDGPQIRQLVKNEHFIGTMTELQKNTWLAFINIVKYFFGNTRTQNYTEIVQQLLESYKMLGCHMSIKLHF
ncbi:hypothetical protein AVEN_275543-1 [Araneus ventricosus]|uniref:RNase H type-1 domain-containing protein n=1 Tax=Araneus ventricosus TaxID=182803 RepID=A0A4Y2P7Q3_ARAVE|nr:hypothetical protein AVEN_275543-1 [Araneus ventricosus]